MYHQKITCPQGRLLCCHTWIEFAGSCVGIKTFVIANSACCHLLSTVANVMPWWQSNQFYKKISLTKRQHTRQMIPLLMAHPPTIGCKTVDPIKGLLQDQCFKPPAGTSRLSRVCVKTTCYHEPIWNDSNKLACSSLLECHHRPMSRVFHFEK